MRKYLFTYFISVNCIFTILFSSIHFGNAFGQTTVNFNYTGSAQTWTVPLCVTTITVTVEGAQGGGTGGLGAIVSGTLAVTPGQVLQINVGGQGGTPAAGWNGGGAGQNANTTANRSSGGGGASDIRVSPYGLGNRIVVGAGGGGMGGGDTDAPGGSGGCTTGTNGNNAFGQGGSGGTQASGGVGGAPWGGGSAGQSGALGVGGNGAADPCYNYGPAGGGGGGYYGGGGGGSDCYSSPPLGGGGGGGGSSLVPAGGSCTAGNNNGNGQVTIIHNAAGSPLGGIASAVTAVCYGSWVNLVLNGYSGTIQWQSAPVSSGPWTNITGATSAIYTTGGLTSNTCFQAVVTLCNTSVTSNIICVTVYPAATLSISSTSVLCNGGNSGSATVNPSGGNSPYTYSWSNGQTTQTITGLIAGSYNVTVTTANGCVSTATIQVAQPNILSATTSQINVPCNGGGNGNATAIPSGGSPAYTYLWSNGQTFSTATGLSVGNYSVTVTDANGCFTATAVTISQPSALSATPSQIDVLCNGGNTGSASVSVSGGTPVYTYLWTNSQMTSVATGLSAGNYSVTVTDANGCTSVSAFTINQPTALSAAPSQTNVICNGGNNGTASVSISGGTPGYSYLWSNGQTTSSISTLPAGNYSVTITDANGCTLVTTLTITQPSALTSSTSQINVLCNGGNNASATVTATGGTPGYAYAWSNGQTTASATGLSAGNYSVIITDANGCTSLSAVSISQPTMITATTSSVNEICNQMNGSASVSASGGTGTFTYLWSNGQTTASATGLQAATYSITVTDANGCTYSTVVTVNSTGGPTANAGPNASVCFGNSTQLTASGGGTYSWVPAGGLNCTTCFNPIASPNSTTTYTVVVTDPNGCMASANVTVTVNVLPLPNAGADVSICAGASAQLNASGGGTYLWSPGTGLNNTNIFNPVAAPVATTTYFLQVTDANGCINSDSMIVTVNPLPSPAFTAPSICFNTLMQFTDQTTGATQWLWNFGEPSSGPNNTSALQNPGHTYSSAGAFTVTLVALNQFGCVDSVQQVVFVNPLPLASFSATTVCIGNPTSFTDLSSITAGNLTNWNWNFDDPGSGSNNISTLQNPSHTYTAAGTFNVVLTVTSDSGCQGSTIIPVTVLPLPVATFSAQNACENIPVIFVNSSTGAQQWYWQFGDGNTSTQQNPSHVYAGYGTYVITFIATSAGGCADSSTATVSIFPSPVPDFTADSVCAGFTNSFTDLSMIPQGNILSWFWNFGDGDTSGAQNPSHNYSSSGTYSASLTVTSNNGCASTSFHNVMVFAQPTAGFSSSPATAELGDLFEFSDLSYSGIVQWFWTFGDGDNSTQQNPSHTYSDTGTFYVTLIVVSQNGCVDTFAYPVSVRDFAFYVPSAFSPNGDDLNEYFSGVGVGIQEYEMQIFDRWNNLVFVTNNYYERWDGTILGGESTAQEDVYVWKIMVKDVHNMKHVYIGRVSVIR